MPNTKIAATLYSMVATKDAVLLVCFWHADEDTGASCWTEIDREPFQDAGTDKVDTAAWDRLSARNRHLLDAE